MYRRICNSVPAVVDKPEQELRTLTLAAGTVIPVRFSDEIDTKTAKPGDTFHATTASNVNLAGVTAIPTRTPVTGQIVEAEAAGRLSGAAELGLELVSVRLPGVTAPRDVSLVTQELSSKAQGRGTNTAEKAGGGAVFGGVVGALAGGGAGAGIGAASGGAFGLGANILTHGKEIDFKPEQLLQFRTAAPLDVNIMLVDGQQIVPQAASPLRFNPAQQTEVRSRNKQGRALLVELAKTYLTARSLSSLV